MRRDYAPPLPPSSVPVLIACVLLPSLLASLLCLGIDPRGRASQLPLPLPLLPPGVGRTLPRFCRAPLLLVLTAPRTARHISQQLNHDAYDIMLSASTTHMSPFFFSSIHLRGTRYEWHAFDE